MKTDWQSNTTLFTRYAWITLGYNILVILWGALVRATGSGAGCGANWPSCQGEFIPLTNQLETMIEFAHRASSGLALLLVLGLVIWAFRSFIPGHRARRAATWSMIFILIEALVGAGLVLFELVAENSSIARAVIISVHLANTFLLLGALTFTALWSTGPVAVQWKMEQRFWLFLSMLSLIVLGMTGAITALGDTLFPLSVARERITNHFLIELRVWHPVLAVFLGAFVAFIAHRTGTHHRMLSWRLIGLIGIQFIFGLMNIWLKAPVWMQMIHLLFADLIWIVFVIFADSVLSGHKQESEPHPN